MVLVFSSMISVLRSNKKIYINRNFKNSNQNFITNSQKLAGKKIYVLVRKVITIINNHNFILHLTKNVYTKLKL